MATTRLPLRPAHGLPLNTSQSGPRRARELAGALLVLAALAILILGGHLLHGGLYTDDWPIAQIYAQDGGVGFLIHELFLGDHSRPLAALYLGLAESIAGHDGHWHAIFGLTVHVLASWSLYWLFRELSMRWWEAGAIAVLALLFPFSDSGWLWFGVSQSNLSMALGAFGLIAIIASLRVSAPRSRWLNGLGALLMASSVLTYESAAGVLIVAVVALAATHARDAVGSWRRPGPLMRDALPRALSSLIAVILAIAVPRTPGLLSGIDPHAGLTGAAQLSHASTMADQAVTLLANSSVPFGAPHRNVVIPAMLVIGVLALLALWRTRSDSSLARELRRWLVWAVCGAAVIVAAYAVFINTDPGFYEPLAPGSTNRVNVVAAVGYCIIIVAIAMLVGTLATRGRRATAAAAIGVVIILVVALGYGQLSRRDVRAWDRAAADQRAALASLSSHVAPPPSATTLYVFGAVGQTETAVFAFRVTWDLNGAVQLLWNDATLRAYPIFADTAFVCGPTSLYPDSFANGDGPAQQAGYGHALFYDLRTSRQLAVRSPADCLRARREFVPGPL